MRRFHPFRTPCTLAMLLLLSIALSGCGGDESAQSAAPGGEAEAEKQAATGQEETAADQEEAAEVEEVEPERAYQLVQEREDLLVLDIRTPDEYKDGHIAGAENIDFYGHGFEQKLRDLEKDQPILLHCASGGRSAKARDLMHNMGFKKVYHFGGGMRAWMGANYPVQKPEKDEGSEQ